MDEQQKRSHGRRMSYSSAAIAMGNMPEEVKMNDPTIHVLMSFKDNHQCPSEDDLVPIIQKLFEFSDRLSGIPEGTFRSPKSWYFKPLQNLDPKPMVRTVNANCDTMEELAEIVQDQRKFYLRDDERCLPWWEFVIIANTGKSESMLCLRVDHAIGDGFSIGNICSTFITDGDGKLLGDFIPESMKLSKQNVIVGQSRCGILWNAMLSMLKIGVLPISRFDSQTMFSKNVARKDVRVSQSSKMVVFEDIPLEFVKVIKDKANASLNDILMTALSQAIHDFCIHHSCPVIRQIGEKTLCRALMIVGFPSKDIRNGLATISLDLGIGINNIVDRLRHIHKTSSKLKKSPIAHCQLALVNKFLPILPLWLYQKIAFRMASRHSLTYTSVPGPDQQVYVAGKSVSMCRSAVLGHLHPIFTVLSYNGNISVTLVGDPEAIPDLHLLPTFFGKGLVALANEFNVKIPLSVNQLW